LLPGFRKLKILNGFRVLWILTARLLNEALRDDPRILESVPMSDEERRELIERLAKDASLKKALSDWIRGIPGTLIRLVPLWLILAAYFGGSVWSPKAAGHDYFAAAAGVIPVLMLALAIETRILRFRWLVSFRPVSILPAYVYGILNKAPDTQATKTVALLRKVDTGFAWLREGYRVSQVVGLAVVVLFLLGLSEWSCMNTLASIGDHTRDPSVVSAGVLAGLVGVGIVAIVGGTEAT